MNLFTLLKINVIITCIHVINILKSSDIPLCQSFFLHIGENITVYRTFGTVESSVAELTLSYILTMPRKIEEHSKELDKDIWNETFLCSQHYPPTTIYLLILR